MSRKYTVFRSFKFAYEGLKEVVINEPNFKIHLIIGSGALVAGILLQLDTSEWLLLLFTICFVLILELFNTAIEKIVDLVSPELHPKAKIAKDVSAAAVLIAAFISILVAYFLFIPKILLVIPQ